MTHHIITVACQLTSSYSSCSSSPLRLKVSKKLFLIFSNIQPCAKHWFLNLDEVLGRGLGNQLCWGQNPAPGFWSITASLKSEGKGFTPGELPHPICLSPQFFAFFLERRRYFDLPSQFLFSSLLFFFFLLSRVLGLPHPEVINTAVPFIFHALTLAR